jgi:hypothetical protein
MKEREWLACTEPEPMLTFLWGKDYERNLRKSRERKARLFAIACVLPWLRRASHEPGLEAVEVSERFADGLSTEADLVVARERLDKRNWETGWVMADDASRAIDGACWTPRDCAYRDQASYAATSIVQTGIYAFDQSQWDQYERNEGLRQCGLIRDIFGRLPFRKVSIPAPVLAWNDSCVVNLATGIYDDRAFDHLPILADALEEAGCTDADVLSHCRQSGEHVRGCWVVDLCLGKR